MTLQKKVSLWLNIKSAIRLWIKSIFEIVFKFMKMAEMDSESGYLKIQSRQIMNAKCKIVMVVTSISRFYQRNNEAMGSCKVGKTLIQENFGRSSN